MVKARLIAVAGATQPIVARGVTYTPTPGTPIDVDIYDVGLLIGSSGFVAAACGGGRGSTEPAQVGTTAQRPAATYGSGVPLAAGAQYVDTDVGAIITWDGAIWRGFDGTAV